MERDQLDRLIGKPINTDHPPVGEAISGIHRVRVRGDSVQLPRALMGNPGMRIFGKYMNVLSCTDSRSQLLVPEDRELTKIGTRIAYRIELTKHGKISIPDLVDFFGESATNLAVAGCGGYLELGIEESLIKETYDDDFDYLDRAFSAFEGLSTDPVLTEVTA